MERRNFLKALAGMAVAVPLGLKPMEEYVSLMLKVNRAHDAPPVEPEPDPEDTVFAHLKELVAKHDFIENIDLIERVDRGYCWQITSKYMKFAISDLIDTREIILMGPREPFFLLDRIVGSHNHALMRKANHA